MAMILAMENINIRDKITLGIITGMLANFVITILDIAFYFLDVNEYLHIHIAASAYFPLERIHSIPALIVGTITDFSIGAILGIIIVYTLFYTGTDFYYIKGISIPLLFWILIYGMVLRLNIGRIDPTDAGTNLVHLSLHIILGFLIAWFTVKHSRFKSNKS